MSSVTYKNQPAIHATRGSVPLAGTEHVYTVKKVLWPSAVEDYLRTKLWGLTLHVCCGKSMLGDVRLDLHESDVNVRGDMTRLPFADESFDTILIDAPYNSKFQIMHDYLNELSRAARKRIIHQHWFMPSNKNGQYKKKHDFELVEVAVWQPQTYFGRVNVITIFDRKE